MEQGLKMTRDSASDGEHSCDEIETRISTDDAVDISELERRIDEEERLLVRCTASWNSGLDKELEDRLAQVWIRAPRVPVLRLDTDDPQTWNALRSWGVLNLPALVFFRSGEQVETVNGLRSVPQLELLIDRWAR